jgi:hypothetical protein
MILMSSRGVGVRVHHRHPWRIGAASGALLLAGEVNAGAMIIALCLASSIVDASPFSTSGALIVANAAEEDRDRVLSQLLRWGVSMIVVAPLLAWAIFILPGWWPSRWRLGSFRGFGFRGERSDQHGSAGSENDHADADGIG